METTTKQEIENLKHELRVRLGLRKPKGQGRVLYTTVKHVSRSGMYRHIAVFMAKKGEIENISWKVAKIMGRKYCDDDSVGVSGCGMDMGFEIVYALGSILYPKGDGHTITGRNGDTKPETDGGYLIKQKWI